MHTTVAKIPGPVCDISCGCRGLVKKMNGVGRGDRIGKIGELGVAITPVRDLQPQAGGAGTARRPLDGQTYIIITRGCKNVAWILDGRDIVGAAGRIAKVP